ncbi:MAG TPA: type II toxin-antitoxin system ParD family antitoxin [Aestuariivirga sp.]|nr:type II toxin-antitoxin system ParD family antitoxin [Aestuariivirga sp.]
MANIEKVSVALTAEQVAAMKAAVDSGEYATTSEIVREALRGWQERRMLRSEELARLRRLIQEGESSGPSRPFDIERIIGNAKAKQRKGAA